MEEKENFYHELDQKSRRSFCTCQTFAGFLLVVAIVIAVGLTSVMKKVTTVISPTRQVSVSRDDAVALQQKMSELSKAPGASTSLIINENELTSLFVEAIGQDKEFPLKSIQVQINPTEIVVDGVATKYLTTSISITLVPKVVSGKPKLELVKIQAGSFSVPTVLTQLIASKLDSLLENKLSQVKGLTIKSIQLEQGRIIISGLNPS